MTPEKFVRAYMEAYKQGKNISQLAAELGITHAACMAKTGKFRSKGVKLPRLKTGKEIDTEYLNDIVSKALENNQDATPEEDALLMTKTCPYCNEEFKTHQKIKIYCSTKCNHAAAEERNYERRKKYKTEWANTRYKELRARGKTKPEIQKSMKIERDCSYCGKPSKKLYCSENCRKKHEAAIVEDQPISKTQASEWNKLKEQYWFPGK